MATKQVHLTWNPEQQFILQDNENHQIILNKPKGVSPSDLLPMALIGCTSYDVVEILKKQRQGVEQLNVTAEALQDETPPWRFRKIHIRYQAIGRGIDIEKLKQAIRISEEKYCSVYATLKDALEITHEAEVVEV
ncbi:MAG: OsmC family protein [Anaerolineales bacterium]|nr:OsmC family protein [Anaerolineales bacterium]